MNHAIHFHSDHESDGAYSPVLFDRCDRCAELAQRPTQLGAERLTQLWSEMHRVEFGGDTGATYRSTNDAIGGRNLYEIALFLERHSAAVDYSQLPITPENGI